MDMWYRQGLSVPANVNSGLMTVGALRRLYFVIFHLVDEFNVHLEKSDGGVVAKIWLMQREREMKNSQVFPCKGMRARFQIMIAYKYCWGWPKLQYPSWFSSHLNLVWCKNLRYGKSAQFPYTSVAYEWERSPTPIDNWWNQMFGYYQPLSLGIILPSLSALSVTCSTLHSLAFSMWEAWYHSWAPCSRREQFSHAGKSTCERWFPPFTVLSILIAHCLCKSKLRYLNDTRPSSLHFRGASL